MLNHELPPEIQYQILTKLPVKSILRCRCVCKTWYSLVSCPNFISDHTVQTLNQSSEDRVLVHRLNTYVNSVSKFSFHDKSFVESHEHHDVPEILRSPEFGIMDIVGSCAGLIFFCKCQNMRDGGTSRTVHRFVLWNPSIRKLVELPSCCSSLDKKLSYLFGLGFDYKNRDYKVVRVVYPETSRTNVEVVAQCDIFDLRKGVWRSSSSPMRTFYWDQPCVYLCGNLHWIRNGDAFTNFTVLSFNLSSEVLQELGMVPSVVENNDYFQSYTKLFPINGLLSAAVVNKKFPAGAVSQLFVSVWSMKEYGVIESWCKLFHIELPSNLTCQPGLVRGWENGEVLITVYHYERENKLNGGCDFKSTRRIVSYNPESKESKVLLESRSPHISTVCYYTETLALL